MEDKELVKDNREMAESLNELFLSAFTVVNVGYCSGELTFI